MSSSNNSSGYQEFDHILNAGRSLVVVQTFEEDRLQKILTAIGSARRQELWVWQANLGLLNSSGIIEGTQAAEAALAVLLSKQDRPPIVWMKDLHHHYRPEVTRSLRDIYYAWRHQGGALVISATQRAIPSELEREAAFIRLPLPDQLEIVTEVEAWASEQGYDLMLDIQVVSSTLKGLTRSEVLHSLSRVQADGISGTAALKALQQEKQRLVSKTGTLQFIPGVPPVNQLGGLEHLKEWLDSRRSLLTSVREEDREIIPKGLLLMGVSGCGKSLCVKAISSAWQLPLYRLEMVRVFSGAYGSPETAFAEACHVMEEMAPAVLWIDEIEMGLSAAGSAALDPTISRIFAFFLTWMQEKPAGLFVAATANRIDLLPAEMIRKGRFDQVFFVDLPNAREREDIFRIHLKKRGYEPTTFTPEVFADATAGWSGAEIEQCVVGAVTSARMEERSLELKDMYASRKEIVPLSTTMEEQVRHIRNWAYERAARASAEA